MNLIHVRLAGGLGNQLFQVAFGLVLARRYGGEVLVNTDSLSSYNTKRKYVLPEVLDLSVNNAPERLLPKIVFKSRCTIFLSALMSQGRFISDANCNNISCIGDPRKDFFLDGYFNRSISQSIFEEMISCLSPRYLWNAEPVKENLCVIHVRGGDFIELGLTSSADAQFYSSAISRVRDLAPNVTFQVVSDDEDYATHLLGGLVDVRCEASTSSIQDFVSLSTAQFAIISDSTFALWARALQLSRSGCERMTLSRMTWEPARPREISFAGELRVAN